MFHPLFTNRAARVDRRSLSELKTEIAAGP